MILMFNAVLKVYILLSVPESRAAQVKDCREFVEAEKCNLLRRIVTRWLSLLPSISDRMLKYWKPSTGYFQSQGEEERDKILKFFGEEDNKATETYFLFLSHILKLFSDTIEAPEPKSFSITSVFKEITELKQKLERRLKDKFFGKRCEHQAQAAIPQPGQEMDVRLISLVSKKEPRNT